jgi:hypothetical protein
MKKLILITILTLMGCTKNINSYKNESPKFDIREFFDGSIKGYGLIMDRNGNVRERFEIDMLAKWQGNNAVITEIFKYSDKSTQDRIWNIQKVDNHKIKGTASDIIGEAKGQQHGNALELNYLLNLKIGKKFYKLNLNDRSFLITKNRLLNITKFKKFGFHVATLYVTFEK